MTDREGREVSDGGDRGVLEGNPDQAILSNDKGSFSVSNVHSWDNK